MSTLPQPPERAMRAVPAVMPTVESPRAPSPAPAPRFRDELADLGLEMSPSIGNLALALSKAQGAMTSALTDKTGVTGRNGDRTYRYATLDSVFDAARPHLTANELSVVQTTEPGGPSGVTVITWLVHSSGEWMRGRLYMPVRCAKDKDQRPLPPDAQGFGSALTYARRYAYSAMVGIASADDDGARAVGADAAPPRAKTLARPSPAMPTVRHVNTPEPAAYAPPAPDAEPMSVEEMAVIQRFDAQWDVVSREDYRPLRRTVKRELMACPQPLSKSARLWYHGKGDATADRLGLR